LTPSFVRSLAKREYSVEPPSEFQGSGWPSVTSTAIVGRQMSCSVIVVRNARYDATVLCENSALLFGIAGLAIGLPCTSMLTKVSTSPIAERQGVPPVTSMPPRWALEVRPLNITDASSGLSGPLALTGTLGDAITASE
jgi:hypothetical protein